MSSTHNSPEDQLAAAIDRRKSRRKGRGRPRSAESHRAILESAARLFDAGGMGNVTMEGIASGAGVSKQTVYRWWDSKTAVVLEAITSRTLVIDNLQIPVTDDIRADIRHLLERINSLVFRDEETPTLVQNLISLVAASGTDAVQLFTPMMDPIRQVLEDRIAAWAQANPGHLSAEPRTIAELIGGGLIWRLLLRQPIDDAWITTVLRVIF